MPTPPPATPTTEELLAQLREAGAPTRDPVGWHYVQALAARSQRQRGPVQAQLRGKLQAALDALTQRLNARAPSAPAPVPRSAPTPALAALAHERERLQRAQAQSSTAWSAPSSPSPDSPRVRQVRRQLGRLRVQKQLSQALAQAPHNAGPINSQMLVLRALALLRERSPEYLNRLMTEVDTLLCLEDAERLRLAAKASGTARGRAAAKGKPERA